MARPIKNNADYFPHDADMRNDPRVKALRRKFKLEGYAIYNLVLEYLTDAEFFCAKTDKLGIELMAGDFDCPTELLEDVINYSVDLGLIQNDNGVLSCKSLNNRLEPLLSKRKRDRTVVIDSENTQSKVKESKVNERREEESKAVGETDDFELLNQFDEWTTDCISGKDYIFDQMLRNEFPNWGGDKKEKDRIAKDHFDLLNRYPKMRPNTQQRFRNSLIKQFREYFDKELNGKPTQTKKLIKLTDL